ncbi:MAG: ATP-binding protein [Rhodoferax sp.]|uniref:sensor histidine kinase n=1 Tax=Rhodoferax sp. TaxID=50421 RepID=UPI002620B5A7|nr:ATP-binding protein [Rhodoferax sp.]MDD2881369.1 ATP-binding protein [Rhodoferax sp.]
MLADGALWPKLSNRIFLRVFGVFGGLLLAMTVLYGLLIIPLQKDSLLKVLYSQAATVSRSVIQACSDAMLTNDYGFVVEHILQVLANNKSIESVWIVPARGSSIHITGQGWSTDQDDKMALAGVSVESAQLVTDPDGSPHYRFTMPIQFSGVKWGVIQINFETREYEANISEMYRQLAGISVFALLINLILGFFFARWLVSPINLISAAAARLGKGELDVKVKIGRDDEIGQLADTFNLMAEALLQNRELMRHYNEALELRVTERTRELDELNRTLDQRVREEIAKGKRQEMLLIQQSRLAAMGEMIGAIAHQWRQPLNALGLVFQNIRIQHRGGRLTEESMTRLDEKAERLMERMSSTIDEFRNFFKPSKHQEWFDLRKSMSAVSDIMEATFKNSGIKLTIECEQGIRLFGIAGELSQVLLNLVSNARDAVIETRQIAPHIQMRANRQEDLVCIEVEDNGGGIAAGILDKVFEPYFSTKDEGKGTGIGLYMSKMIVESYLNGRLEAVNINKGACLRIEISTATTAYATRSR